MPAKITLTVTEGKLAGKQFTFDSRTACIIGRAKDCNIEIPNDRDHSRISRYHCLLDINPPHIRIRDFGSRHGTFVNGECIGRRGENQTPQQGAKLNLGEYDLKNGDRIKLDNTSFTVEIDRGIDRQFKVDWIVPGTQNIELRTIWEISNLNSNPRLVSAFIK